MRYITGFAIPAGTVDTATVTGTKISPAQWVYASFMAYFSENTAAGTLQIQYSNDAPAGRSEENFVPTNWANVPGSTATATISDGASNSVYVPNGFCGRWYRIVFTPTGGVGTFAVTFCAVVA